MNDAPAFGTEQPPVTDYAAARDHMVDGQVRPNKIIDPRIITAMRRLPRERFVPASLAARAYLDDPLPLPGGRALMEPMVIARLIQLLRVRAGERGLVIGAGSGYGAAILESSTANLVALEEDPALLALARAILPQLAPRVRLVEGPIAAGWPAEGPYDFILIEGGVQSVPDNLSAQLTPHGRLAAVMVERPGAPGKGVLAEAVHIGAETRLRAQPFFDCNTPLLPQLRPKAAFTF